MMMKAAVSTLSEAERFKTMDPNIVEIQAQMYCLRRGEIGVLEKSSWIPTLYSISLKLDGAGHIYH